MACSKFSESSMKTIMECGICMQIYNTSERVPKVIPCGHTFCQSCLGRLTVNRYIRCPSCRRSVLVSVHGSVDKLPTNYSLLSLLDVSCEECQNNYKTGKCDHCHKSLCTLCHNQHMHTLHKEVTGITETTKKQMAELRGKLESSRCDNYKIFQTKVAVCKQKVNKLYNDLINRVSAIVNHERQEMFRYLKKCPHTGRKHYMLQNQQAIKNLEKQKKKLRAAITKHGEKYNHSQTVNEMNTTKELCENIKYQIKSIEETVSTIPDIDINEKDKPVLNCITLSLSQMDKDNAAPNYSVDTLHGTGTTPGKAFRSEHKSHSDFANSVKSTNTFSSKHLVHSKPSQSKKSSKKRRKKPQKT